MHMSFNVEEYVQRQLRDYKKRVKQNEAVESVEPDADGGIPTTALRVLLKPKRSCRSLKLPKEKTLSLTRIMSNR